MCTSSHAVLYLHAIIKLNKLWYGKLAYQSTNKYSLSLYLLQKKGKLNALAAPYLQDTISNWMQKLVQERTSNTIRRLGTCTLLSFLTILHSPLRRSNRHAHWRNECPFQLWWDGSTSFFKAMLKFSAFLSSWQNTGHCLFQQRFNKFCSSYWNPDCPWAVML